MRRLVQQVRDAAIAGDGYVEPFVASSVAACFQFHAAGLDVVEVRDDHPRFGDRGLTVPQLPHHRLTRVLLVLGGGAAQECHPDFVPQHRGRHA
ncbi:hypothetical protein A5789_27970 [Nocardia sp. 852002-51101_SCH5132738]|nr:hypothetical protein A5789_27970 [Nocardia sp. 852002-51101_SCH5132738]OBB52146.1 hypothetical protein A5748_15820 [Nocardia sp. 852002-51244_SCH5132740]OBF72659.1 hypothetical protein A9X06_28080 [Mycobacterium sp. 852002-51759_SCH5129042]